MGAKTCKQLDEITINKENQINVSEWVPSLSTSALFGLISRKRLLLASQMLFQIRRSPSFAKLFIRQFLDA